MENSTNEVELNEIKLEDNAELEAKAQFEVKIDKKIWLNSFKTVGKILLSVIFVVFYLISALFFVAPKFDAKIFNFMGLSRAEEACYVKQYENTGELVDLYNLVLFEQELGEAQKELYYINILMKDDGYEEFCEKLNASGIYNAGSKSMYIYVGDVNAYLVNRKVKGLYALNLTCETEVLNSLKSGKLTEYAISTYVDIIKNQSMTTAQKNQKYQDLLNTTVLSGGSTVSVATLLDERINDIENRLAEEDVAGGLEEVLLCYALMRLNYAGYTVYNAVGEDSIKIAGYEQAYEESAQKYLSLI